jgi:hypothetical protein
MMDSIPFEDEVLRGQPPEEQRVESLLVTADMQSEIEQLDEGQLAALNHALESRVTLIQG